MWMEKEEVKELDQIQIGTELGEKTELGGIDLK
jgi:hypothetical protein